MTNGVEHRDAPEKLVAVEQDKLIPGDRFLGTGAKRSAQEGETDEDVNFTAWEDETGRPVVFERGTRIINGPHGPSPVNSDFAVGYYDPATGAIEEGYPKENYEWKMKTPVAIVEHSSHQKVDKMVEEFGDSPAFRPGELGRFAADTRQAIDRRMEAEKEE